MTSEIRPLPEWRGLFAESFASFSPALLVGLVSGFLIGGVGGRLAMFVLRLTSSDSLHGVETDDGFIIGSFTSDTFFLLIATMVMGAIGGLIYVGVREWLPLKSRPFVVGLLGATVGGVLIIRPDGVDFTSIEPLSLAVIMFVAIPALYGVSLSLLTERLTRGKSFARSRWKWAGVLILAPVVLTGPVGIVFLVLFCLGVAANRTGLIGRLWRSSPVTWAGRGVIAAILAVSTGFLIKDVAAVLQ